MSKRISLTLEQINFIRESLKEENCLIITQKLWHKINKKLRFKSQKTYSRRKGCAGLTYHDLCLGYTTEEFIPDIHPFKSLLQIDCENCGIRCVVETRQLMSRKHWEHECCYKCYHKLYQQDEEWRKKQSMLQTESQHRPEVLAKHRHNSREMWKRNHDKMVATFKKRMAVQENRDKIAATMRKRWQEDEKYRDRVNGKGILKHSGIFEKSITYDSKLELMFLLWCIDNEFQVKRADCTLPYIDEFNKERDYYPDFIVNHHFLVEVKGQRWIDENKFCFDAKCRAAENFCFKNGMEFLLIHDSFFSRKDRKRALSYHETQKENSSTL